jgi:hypothetical protein
MDTSCSHLGWPFAAAPQQLEGTTPPTSRSVHRNPARLNLPATTAGRAEEIGFHRKNEEGAGLILEKRQRRRRRRSLPPPELSTVIVHLDLLQIRPSNLEP